MRKDFIIDQDGCTTEDAFVETYWTKVWEREGGPQGQVSKVPRQPEFKAMRPHLARLPAGARILDGGCGLGDWTLYFGSLGFSPVGMDISRHTVEQLRQRFPDTEFVAGDIRNTGFPDESFNAIFSWGVFEHFEDGQQSCIREAFRLLKPGGMLFVTVPYDNLRQALRGTLGGWKAETTQAPRRFYQYRLTAGELTRELTAGGFTVVDSRPIHKRQGVQRFLHHELGLPYGQVTRALGVALAPFVPGWLIAHMLFAAARKAG